MGAVQLVYLAVQRLAPVVILDSLVFPVNVLLIGRFVQLVQLAMQVAIVSVTMILASVVAVSVWVWGIVVTV
jgi:hypothetical protein